jgi:subtilisin family serine protease
MPHSILMGRRARCYAQVAVVGALGLAMSACKDVAVPVTGVPESGAPVQSQYVNAGIPDEYIVVFNSDVTDVEGRANALAKAHGANVHFAYGRLVKGFSARMSAQAAAALANDPSVDFVEPDQVIEAAAVGGAGVQTPVVGGLDRIDQRGPALDNSYSWSNDGSGVTVYILDSGVRITHQDFGGRASYGPDFVSNSTSDDCNGHGTHMAGTVGGAVYGVAKGVNLVSVRVLGCDGKGTASTAIAALDWVARNHAPLAVANLSFSGPLSLTLNQAVANTIAANVTVVAAAGEQGAPPDACQYSPGSAAGALTVGGSRSIAGPADGMGLTNYGPCVDLFAPGWSVVSDWYTGNTILWMLSGTSSAAAHASGAAAIYLAKNPSASPAGVMSALIANATTGTISDAPSGTANRLLYTGDGSVQQPPPPPPSTEPTPTNQAPVAQFTVSCSKGRCTYNASGSTDDAGIVSYRWSFGDGTSESKTTSTTTHSYTAKGRYSVTVTLTVADAAGLTATAQQTVSINNNGK